MHDDFRKQHKVYPHLSHSFQHNLWWEIPIIIRYHTYCLALNHLIILGKYFLYVNAVNKLIYKFDDFVSLVWEKINMGKYIAVTCNKEKEFRKKWKFFLS